jgi:Uma2 family endonuclease
MIDVATIAHPQPVPHPAGAAWTVADFLALPADGRRYELIEGTLYMTPGPRLPHQDTSRELTVWLVQHLAARRARILAAPFDVFLADDVVVQPDLLVLLPERMDLLAADGVHGAPNVVIEIASPGTATYDRHQKLLAYARAEVPEYWLVDTSAMSLEILVLKDRRYQNHALITGPADVPSPTLGMLPGPVSRFFVA